MPNRAAHLLLGRDPRSYLPGAYLQFVRFDGSDFDAPILDQKELVGRAGDVLREADTLARLNIRVATVIEGESTERRSPDYTVTVLEQLLRNAVLHRSYEFTRRYSGTGLTTVSKFTALSRHRRCLRS